MRETPGGNVLVLRAFMGVTFVFAGLQKLANPAFFKSSDPTGIESQMKASESFSPIGGIISPVLHVAVLLGVLIAVGELAVGVGTLIGFKGRLAAGAGMLLSLTFFLTVSFNASPYYYGADIVFLFAWTPFLLGGSGSFSLDAWLATRRAEVETAAAAAAIAAGMPDGELAALDRREVVTTLGATTLVGAVVVSLGGLTAAIGRMASGARSPKHAAMAPKATQPTGGSGTTPTSTTKGTSDVTSQPTGKRIGPASRVPVGEAAAFTTSGGVPAYVIRPSESEYVAFSRVCTHEQCIVNYVHSAQQFQCPCHGSIYSAVTGEVLRGPAPLPLPKIRIIESTSGQLYADGTGTE